MVIEVIIMLGSAVVGSIIKMMAAKTKSNNQIMELALRQNKQNADNVAETRNSKDKQFKFTRRLIALSVIGSVIVLPIVAAVFNLGDTSVWVSWTETTSGFWPFIDGKDVVMWKEMDGIVITPLHTQLTAAIAGLYFGVTD